MRGVTLSGDGVHEALVALNLGVLRLSTSDVPGATEQLRRAIEISAQLDPEVQAAACLLVPKIVEGAVELEEIWDPNILDVATTALGVAELVARDQV